MQTTPVTTNSAAAPKKQKAYVAKTIRFRHKDAAGCSHRYTIQLSHNENNVAQKSFYGSKVVFKLCTLIFIMTGMFFARCSYCSLLCGPTACIAQICHRTSAFVATKAKKSHAMA